MNLIRRSRIAVVGLATAILAVAALATLPAVHAQERRLDLKPDGSIDQPLTFLPANGIEIALPAGAAVNLTATGSTTVFTIPAGQTPNATFVGGLPVPGVPATLSFFVTSIDVENVTATGVSAGAVFRVGNQTTDTAVLATGSMANTAAVGTFQHFTVAAPLILKTGDSIVFKVTTGATATAQTAKVHVRGFYQ